jgi:hypothetical protein
VLTCAGSSELIEPAEATVMRWLGVLWLTTGLSESCHEQSSG